MVNYENNNPIEIDLLDRKILDVLQNNSRKAFTDIAKTLNVSSGTIHQRYNKLVENRVIVGSKIKIDFESLGYDVTTLLGVYLKNGNEHEKVVEKLKKLKTL